MKSISVIGNCQSRELATCLSIMMPNISVAAGYSRDIREGKVSLVDLVQESDVIVSQTVMQKKVLLEVAKQGSKAKVIIVPTLYFSGFHPDFVYATHGNGNVNSPLAGYNSAIVLYAWLHGRNPSEALSLFRPEVFQYLGYFDYYNEAKRFFLDEAKSLGFDLSQEFESWERSGCFMHTPNHPKMMVSAGIARVIVDHLGIVAAVRYPESIATDSLANNAVWPVYPEIGEALGIPGQYVFKASQGKREPGQIVKIFSLTEFIEQSFSGYAELDRNSINCARFEDPRYKTLSSVKDFEIIFSKVGKCSRHPYKDLPDYHFWKNVVADPKPADVDPVVNAKFRFDSKTKIATAGSCFAQHIARALQSSGFKYYVAESGDGLDDETLKERQFGVFSARYGNIYTPAQLLQLFDRAYGIFEPEDEAWLRSDGRLLDPFRPQIEPAGFGSLEELRDSREAHFDTVRSMWKNLDVFIFTLGLTEAWRAKSDGAIFPLAPGVAGGEMNFDRYEFHNFTVNETVDLFNRFLVKLRQINPVARVIITVSPVPLMATYEDTHVLQATTYSKAVLRVAADQIAAGHDWVDYFPSFEIITGSYNRGAYYDNDLRTITEAGVKHVMRLFFNHYTLDVKNEAPLTPLNGMLKEFTCGQEVICEEELLGKI